MRRSILTVVVASTFLAGLLAGYLQAAASIQPMLHLAGALPGPAQAPAPAGGQSASRPAAPASTSAAAPAQPAGPQQSAARPGPAATPSAAAPGETRVHPCGPAATGFARCHAVLLQPAGNNHFGSTGPAGLNPPDLQSAYALPSGTAGAGETVAVVDAFDDPDAESDLAVYRAQFGLPACTTAGGCFSKVAQDGGARFPRTNASWALEISLDLDMVSAVCPRCHILLVEADDSRITNLLAAVDEAAALGATELSNSYGGAELSAETGLDAHFNHPTIAITASSGDGGFGVQYPAASPFVTAVGGTTLTKDPAVARGWSETAWSGAGSGCSAFEAQPSWQAANRNVVSVCGARAVADVSADADPGTGVSVFDSVSFQGSKGWLIVGGTSVGAPVIASVFALAGGVTGSPAAGSLPYANVAALNDVTSGSNGACGSILCTATGGWDGPTGLGTPATAGAF